MSYRFNGKQKFDSKSYSKPSRLFEKSESSNKFIFSGNRLDFEKLNTRIQIEITQSKNAALLKEFMVDNFNDPLPEKIHRTSNS